jgi:gliding motility-associated-like protein
MNYLFKIIFSIYILCNCFFLKGQIPNFVVDTIFNSGDSIYRVSTSKSHNIWYTGGKDSNEIYQIKNNSVFNHSSIYQSNSSFVITDLYSTSTDSVLIATLGGIIYHLGSSNLIQLNASNGLNNLDYNSFYGTGEIMNPILPVNYEKFVFANSHNSANSSVNLGQNFSGFFGPSSSNDTINIIEVELSNSTGFGYSYERLEMFHVISNGQWRYKSVNSSTNYSHNAYMPNNFRPNSVTYWMDFGFNNFKFFIATDSGLRVIRENPFTDIICNPTIKFNKVLKYYPKTMSPGVVLIGSDSGLYAMNKFDWSLTKINLGFNCKVFDIAKEEDCIWLATDTGLIKLKNIDCGYAKSSIVFGDIQSDSNGVCYIPISLNCSNCVESVSWNFGDSTLSNNFNENHYYMNSDKYIVTATVNNGYCSQVITDSIDIKLCCSPSYYPLNLITNDSICKNDTIIINSHPNNDTFFWLTDSSTLNHIIPDTSGIYTVVITSDYGCKDTTSIEILMFPKSQINLPLDTSICFNQSINLTLDSNLFYNTIWLDTIFENSIHIDSIGDYYLSYNDSFNCIYNDTIRVTNFYNNSIDLGVDSSYCYEFIISPTKSYISYLWSNNSIYDSISINSSGIYWLQVIDTNNCTYSDTISITIFQPPSIDLGNDTTICSNEILILNSQNPNTLWSTGFVGSSIQIDTSGIYSATYIDSLGCEINGSIIINIQPAHSVNLNGNINNCIGDSIFLNVYDSNSTYLWHNNSTSSNYISTNTENIWVIVTKGVCSVSDSLNILFSDLPLFNPETEWKLCSDSNYIISLLNNNYNFLWSTGEINSSINVSGPGEYSVIVTNESCSVERVFKLSECEINVSIPNTITPNGDGFNDFWIINNIEKFPNHSIQIFNRNGSIVFNTSNYQNDWDGKFKGNDLPATTYYYLIDLGVGESVLKGDISIIRE